MGDSRQQNSLSADAIANTIIIAATDARTAVVKSTCQNSKIRDKANNVELTLAKQTAPQKKASRFGSFLRAVAAGASNAKSTKILKNILLIISSKAELLLKLTISFDCISLIFNNKVDITDKRKEV